MLRKIVYPDAEHSIVWLFTDERLSKLNSIGKFEIFYGEQPDHKTCVERLNGAQAIILGWGISNQVLTESPDLEVISFIGLGASTFIDLAETRRRNITVTHTLSAATTVAEHTMALMLDAARHLSRQDRNIRAGNWDSELMGMDLRGKTLGLVGFGHIAEAVVPLAKAFGMRVVSWTRHPGTGRASQHGVEFIGLNELLESSDVVSLHLLSTPETNGLLSAEILSLLKPGVIVINTARSQILDETAFVALLKSGHIAAAGVDVFDNEPIPADHPFRTMDNVVVTPHIAYNTPEALEQMYDTAIDNLLAYYSGTPQNIAEAKDT